ncbi:peroxiredoxin-5, mitochondrial [Amblyraja radiata]|uniref:peroxiredoxin-5, mitochondrial n=1 Tax=Amblyraja radiata TaxID=386614 RepID=UPI0014020FBC|nr:peroxiredoxin-5, mitochondrial [Amblyraja radiata]XP_032871273.1 peroxiredoxin-5, mitochondrial [Amblyraja radiata]XP_032871274.1 peroxiredoxin-5, mitochondrial [Amblyraja radiata]XP_032871275.1 peroxiredoxin-5, mitochondrial [Amblyraja radiata]
MNHLLIHRLRATASIGRRHFQLSHTAAMPIKVGDKLPSVEVHEGDPHCVVNIADIFKGKKGILFGVPGAYTPACNNNHLPSYVEGFEELKKKGVEIVACIAVNDAFVMKAWGSQLKADGKVRMLADPTGAFTRAIDLELDKEQLIAALGNKRCKRFVMVLEDGVVKKLNVEADGTGVTCSLAKHAKDML